MSQQDNQEIDHKIPVESDSCEKKIKRLTKEVEGLRKRVETLEKFNLAVFSNLSHEIRTPMNGVLGFSEIINDSSLTDKDREYYSELIAESSNLLLHIVTDVFDIVKIHSGSYRVYPVKFDLNDMMFQLYQNYKPIAEKKDLQLFLENVVSTTFIVENDPLVLERILKKLIDNALKFTRQGYVKFYYKVKADELQFFVEDTGIGIQEEQRTQIFERFTSIPVSQTRNLGGSGIDLSLCHGFVTLMGGEIALLPTKQQGSIFQFTVPRYL
jgi:signal transduction histidine kinase